MRAPRGLTVLVLVLALALVATPFVAAVADDDPRETARADAPPGDADGKDATPSTIATSDEPKKDAPPADAPETKKPVAEKKPDADEPTKEEKPADPKTDAAGSAAGEGKTDDEAGESEGAEDADAATDDAERAAKLAEKKAELEAERRAKEEAKAAKAAKDAAFARYKKIFASDDDMFRIRSFKDRPVRKPVVRRETPKPVDRGPPPPPRTTVILTGIFQADEEFEGVFEDKRGGVIAFVTSGTIFGSRKVTGLDADTVTIAKADGTDEKALRIGDSLDDLASALQGALKKPEELGAGGTQVDSERVLSIKERLRARRAAQMGKDKGKGDEDESAKKEEKRAAKEERRAAKDERRKTNDEKTDGSPGGDRSNGEKTNDDHELEATPTGDSPAADDGNEER